MYEWLYNVDFSCQWIPNTQCMCKIVFNNLHFYVNILSHMKIDISNIHATTEETFARIRQMSKAFVSMKDCVIPNTALSYCRYRGTYIGASWKPFCTINSHTLRC